MKKLILFVLMLALAVMADAQTKRKKDTINLCETGHYVVADLGGGVNTHTFKLDNDGFMSPGMGLMFRGGYRYFFTKNWGVGADLNFKSFMSSGLVSYSSHMDDVDDHDEWNPEHSKYQHQVVYHNLKERQKQSTLSIPIAAYYQYRVDRTWKLGAGLGFYYQFTDLTSKYETKKGFVEAKGYLDEWNVLFEDMPQHNFDTKENFSGKNVKRSCLGLYVEGNLLYYINPRLSVDIGLYVCKGFAYQNNRAANDLYSVDDNSINDGVYSGMWQSNLVQKSNPLAIGVMGGVRYRLKFERSPRIKDHDKPKPPHDTIPMILDTIPHVPVAAVDTPANPEDNTPEKDSVPNQVVSLIPTQPVDSDDVPGVENDTVPEPVLVVDTDKPEEVDIDYNKIRRISVTFLFNDTIVNLNPAQIKMFDDISKLMNQQTDLKIKLVGHTCNIGTWEQNIYVGQKRAEFCKQQLIDRGVSANRISTDSKAYSQPLVPNTSEENRRKNRRIEFIIR